MKKPLLALIFTITALTFCNAQHIKVEKVFGGYKYTQNDEYMTMTDLVNAMENNTKAFELIKKAKSNSSIATILGFAGGGLIGFPIGQSLGGRDANWALAGIGAGLVAIAIPISSSANKKTNKAVELYNASLNSSAHYQFKPEFNIITNGNGVGFSVRF